jgi:hypothetical protein
VVYLAETGNTGVDQWRIGVNRVKKLSGSKNVEESYEGQHHEL